MAALLPTNTLHFFQIVKEQPGATSRLPVKKTRSKRSRLLLTSRFLGPWPADASIRFGGGERDRTDDLLLAKQALSQLSYTPVPEISCILISGL